jgi:LysR family transcriptional regulator, benzoate and cis,cis-muconate-responsive activator of ben and cat genes
MELRQLKLFVILAEELNFTKAAERGHISQPALTRSIQNLERTLGVKLFDRSKTQVKLTEAGRTTLEDARGIILQAERLKQRHKEPTVSVLRVLYDEYALYGFALIHRAAMAFEANYPEVVLELHDENNSVPQAKLLLEGKMDIGIVGATPNIEPSERLSWEWLYQDPFIAILPASHPLAKQEGIKPGQLEGETLFLFPGDREPMWQDYILPILKKEGLVPTHIENSFLLESHISGVQLGRGISLVPKTAEEAVRPGIVARPLQAPLWAGPIVWWRKDNDTPQLRAFLDTVRGIAKTLPPNQQPSV